MDEALAGYADTIDVTLAMADGAVRVRTTAAAYRPIFTRPRGVSAVELVLTQLHAGGKFGGGDTRSPAASHGVGSSVVNALSSRLDVCVRQKGHAFPDVLRPWRADRAADADGTDQRDRDDDHLLGESEIFESVEYDYETIRARSSGMPFSTRVSRSTSSMSESPGRRQRRVDLDNLDEGVEGGRRLRGRGRTKRDQSWSKARRSPTHCHDNGLVDYATHLVASKRPTVNPEIIAIEVEDADRSLSLELAMQWTTAYSESSIPTPTRSTPP